VNQGVDRHHANADFEPSWIMLRTGNQNPGQGHRQNLVRHGVHVSERPDQRFEFETLSGDEIQDLLKGKKPNRESVLEPTTPRTSAVPPAGKPRPRPDPDPGLEPQPQA
jgi:hypothetical protein